MLLPGTDTSPLKKKAYARKKILPVVPHSREERVVSQQLRFICVCDLCPVLVCSCTAVWKHNQFEQLWDGLYELRPRPVHAKMSHPVTSQERQFFGR